MKYSGFVWFKERFIETSSHKILKARILSKFSKFTNFVLTTMRHTIFPFFSFCIDFCHMFGVIKNMIRSDKTRGEGNFINYVHGLAIITLLFFSLSVEPTNVQWEINNNAQNARKWKQQILKYFFIYTKWK